MIRVAQMAVFTVAFGMALLITDRVIAGIVATAWGVAP